MNKITKLKNLAESFTRVEGLVGDYTVITAVQGDIKVGDVIKVPFEFDSLDNGAMSVWGYVGDYCVCLHGREGLSADNRTVEMEILDVL